MKLVRWQAGIYTMGICMTRSLHGPETRAWTAVSPGDGIDHTTLSLLATSIPSQIDGLKGKDVMIPGGD